MIIHDYSLHSGIFMIEQDYLNLFARKDALDKKRLGKSNIFLVNPIKQNYNHYNDNYIYGENL